MAAEKSEQKDSIVWVPLILEKAPNGPVSAADLVQVPVKASELPPHLRCFVPKPVVGYVGEHLLPLADALTLAAPHSRSMSGGLRCVIDPAQEVMLEPPDDLGLKLGAYIAKPSKAQRDYCANEPELVPPGAEVLDDRGAQLKCYRVAGKPYRPFDRAITAYRREIN